MASRDELGFSPMEGFNIGQNLAGGSKGAGVGAFVMSLTDQLDKYLGMKAQSQAQIQTAVGMEQATAPIKLQNELIVEREKSKLQQQQQQQSMANMQEMLGLGTPSASGAEGAASRFRQGKRTMSFTTDAEGNLKPTISIQEMEGLTGEQAGRAGLVKEGIRQAREARGLLFPSGSAESYRKEFAQRAFLPFSAGQAIGSEQGRTDYQDFDTLVKNAIEAKLRAETGATAPPEEVRRISQRFIPGIFTTSKSAMRKMDELERFLSSAQVFMDPSGKFSWSDSPQTSTIPSRSSPSSTSRIKVRNRMTGDIGTVSEHLFNPTKHERL